MFPFGRAVAVVGIAYVSVVTVADAKILWSEGNVRVISTTLPPKSIETCFLSNRAADGTRLNIVRYLHGTVLGIRDAGALKKITVKLPDGDKTWDLGGTKDITRFAADLLEAMSSLRTVTVVVEGASKTVSFEYPGTTAVGHLNACVKQLH